MGYRIDLWELAASRNGVVTVAEAEDAGVPAVSAEARCSRRAPRIRAGCIHAPRRADVPVHRTASCRGSCREGAFLHRESVLYLLGLGQFNPPKVRVGTRRRVRRTLPEWMELENRPDVPEEDLTHYEGIPATTVHRALKDMRDRMPPDRWEDMVDEALRRDLIGEQDAAAGRRCRRD